MIQKFLSVMVIALVVTSCGNTGSNNNTSSAEGTGESSKIEFTELVEHPQDFVGKNISVEGKVVHVCMMSGKKMFIVGDNPDIRLFITAGEDMPKFPTELLGSSIVVEGTLERTATASAEAKGGEGMHATGAHAEAGADSCETETALARQPVLSDLMMVYNRHTVK